MSICPFRLKPRRPSPASMEKTCKDKLWSSTKQGRARTTVEEAGKEEAAAGIGGATETDTVVAADFYREQKPRSDKLLHSSAKSTFARIAGRGKSAFRNLLHKGTVRDREGKMHDPAKRLLQPLRDMRDIVGDIRQ